MNRKLLTFDGRVTMTSSEVASWLQKCIVPSLREILDLVCQSKKNPKNYNFNENMIFHGTGS